MQRALFPETDDPTGGGLVEAAPVDPALTSLAASQPPQLRLGTSSWNYPGWRGLVWRGDYPEATLSRYGLPAYARHPLFGTAGIDRGFYRPLTTAQFRQHAEQVPAGFRFVVKAPAAVTDALLRDEGGCGQRVNQDFLDPRLALRSFVEPALAGLGAKLGAMVFQIAHCLAAGCCRCPSCWREHPGEQQADNGRRPGYPEAARSGPAITDHPSAAPETSPAPPPQPSVLCVSAASAASIAHPGGNAPAPSGGCSTCGRQSPCCRVAGRPL